MIRQSPSVASPLQRQWLAYLRDRNAAVTLYLCKGLALRGQIAAFDEYTLLLAAGDGQPSLVYKHAVATVVPLNPAEPSDLFERAEPPP